MFPKTPQQGYPDLYEEVAAGHYTIESVFKTHSSDLRRKNPTSAVSHITGPKNNDVVVVKKRKFSRPNEATPERHEPTKLTPPKF